MRQPLLNRVQELLRLLLSLRHNQDVDVRILSDPIRHIIDRDRHALITAHTER